MLKTDKPRVVVDLEITLAQLRHAYQQILGGHVPPGTLELFANGLIAPEIRRLEGVIDQLTVGVRTDEDAPR